MIIRFEVAPRKSFGWDHFVKRAERVGDCNVAPDLFVVEVKTTDAAIEIWQCVRGWRCVTVFVDGKIMGSAAFNHALWNIQNRPLRTSDMLNDIITRADSKRGRGDDGNRWRMGMGPEPRGGA